MFPSGTLGKYSRISMPRRRRSTHGCCRVRHDPLHSALYVRRHFHSAAASAFCRAFPSINVHVELTPRNVDFAAEGIDVGIRIRTPPPDAIARRIMGNPIILRSRVEYLARFGTPSVPADLATRDLLLIGSPQSNAIFRLWKAGTPSLVTTSPKILSSDPAFILQCVLESAGVGQISVIFARNEIAKGELVQVLLEWTMPEADISIIYPAGRALAPRVRVFVDFICEALAR